MSENLLNSSHHQSKCYRLHWRIILWAWILLNVTKFKVYVTDCKIKLDNIFLSRERAWLLMVSRSYQPSWWSSWTASGCGITASSVRLSWLFPSGLYKIHYIGDISLMSYIVLSKYVLINPSHLFLLYRNLAPYATNVRNFTL